MLIVIKFLYFIDGEGGDRMIRILTEDDRDDVLNLVEKKAAENLFIIGDVEVFGFDTDFQKLWGQFDDNGKLKAVLLKFEGNYIPYAEGEYDLEGFSQIINEDPDLQGMSGLKELAEPLLPYIKKQPRNSQSLYYAKCVALKELKNEDQLSHVKLLTIEELEEQIELLKSIPEFDSASITLESKKRVFETKTGRTYICRVDGKIASTASSTAENQSSAMIVAVATKENFKRRGLATDCMIKLCKELLEEGKELCLFYDNPDAGVIYKRLGFEDIGFWNMYRY